jgi:DNA adenine methylase
MMGSLVRNTVRHLDWSKYIPLLAMTTRNGDGESVSKLYGKSGDLHISFEHQRFATLIQNCPQRWLITYDDSPSIRENFKSAYLNEWELQYGMNNYKQNGAKKGKELFITNYNVNNHENLQAPIQLSLELLF